MVNSVALSTEFVLRIGAFDHTGKQWSSAEEMKKLVNHVYFSPDGQWMASASFDKSVKLWNGTTGKFVAAFQHHVGPIYQISWSADSRLLLSGSKDSTLKVFVVDWSPDGEKVASGGKDRVLKCWMG